jgi:hypothetical protein
MKYGTFGRAGGRNFWQWLMSRIARTPSPRPTAARKTPRAPGGAPRCERVVRLSRALLVCNYGDELIVDKADPMTPLCVLNEDFFPGGLTISSYDQRLKFSASTRS